MRNMGCWAPFGFPLGARWAPFRVPFGTTFGPLWVLLKSAAGSAWVPFGLPTHAQEQHARKVRSRSSLARRGRACGVAWTPPLRASWMSSAAPE